jgi:hypothetical protein
LDWRGKVVEQTKQVQPRKFFFSITHNYLANIGSCNLAYCYTFL